MSNGLLHSRLKSVVDGYEPASEKALISYAVDGMVPSAIVAPDSIESLSAILKMASVHGYTVIPRGGGSKMDFGLPPSRGDIAVSMEFLNRIISHDPADQTSTVEAGITMACLQAGLEKKGQYLPLDPPHGDVSTLGGVLATNACGLLRTSYGTARDMVIGVRVVQADGTIVKSGGQVVKNVAGYDLNKMYIGSLGTLGILAEVTLKLQPLPAGGKIVIGRMPLMEMATDCAFRIMDSDIMPSFLELSNPETISLALQSGGVQDDDIPHQAGFPIVAGLIGLEETVLWQVNECERICKEMGAIDVIQMAGDRYHQTLESLRRFPSGCSMLPARYSKVTCRASVTPDQVGGLYQLAEDRCQRYSIGLGFLSHFTSGHVAFVFYQDTPFQEANLEALASIISDLRNFSEQHGAFVMEHAPVALKKEVGVWGSSRGNQEIMARLKSRFDPKGLLNPGRFVDGI